jgi:predicted Na+-dependent transporter
LAEDRTVLSIATSSRHPGLALALPKANFPEESTLVAGALVIYLTLRLILAIPYTRWQRHAWRAETTRAGAFSSGVCRRAAIKRIAGTGNRVLDFQ